MSTSSDKSSNKARKKFTKIHRNQPVIARKIIAFQELTSLEKHKHSDREAASLLEIPNSTMQSWRNQTSSQHVSPELEEFFSTPVGADFLQRNVIAVMKLMKSGPGGIRGMQEYLRNTGLDHFVAASDGALQSFWERCEEYILKFGEREEKRLSEGMRHRKITAGLDEMFRSRRPCLVAIEVVSNYILLEKFTEDRTAETWKKELEPRINAVNVELGQVVSDLCGAIRVVTKDLGAEHISELFHAQYEISKATAAALGSQERAAEKALYKNKEKVENLKSKPRKIGKEESKKQKREIDIALKDQEELEKVFEEKKERRKTVQAAVIELGKIHNPINLADGTLQSAEEIEQKFNEQFETVQRCAEEANLSQPSMDRLEKAHRAFDAIVHYLKYFFVFFVAFVDGLKLSLEQEKFFKEVVFPYCYLRMIWKRLKRKEKEQHRQLLENLESRIRDGPWSEELKQELLKKGRELAEVYQRSSSCVEGRNGVLSLNYHRFHRLNERSLRVLTIIHNFGIKRKDGTTAAERFFEQKHEDLFESLVKNVRIPRKPQRQYHDPKKRQIGWEKRRCAA